MKNTFEEYARKLTTVIQHQAWGEVDDLANSLLQAWQDKRQLFLCGNGGSAANAIHLANDFLYGIGDKAAVPGMRVEALPANPAVLTCLANDTDYSKIFAIQLLAKAQKGDLLLVLSGSGNSPNVVQALEEGNRIGMKTFAIVAFSGGACAEIAQRVIHLEIEDMQIAEDLQLVIGHMCMKWLVLQSEDTYVS